MKEQEGQACKEETRRTLRKRGSRTYQEAKREDNELIEFIFTLPLKYDNKRFLIGDIGLKSLYWL